MSPSKSVLAAAVTAAALAALPAAAQAPGPVFAAFAAVCAQPAANYDGVVAAASAHGWTASDVAPDPGMSGVTIASSMTKATSADKVGLVLSAWTGVNKGGVKISDCAVHVAKSDFDALKGQAGAWLAFPAQDSSAKKVSFRFTDADGGHRALTPPDFDAAAAGSGLQILTVSADAKGTVLDLMMIKK